jgi:universal stress protein E
MATRKRSIPKAPRRLAPPLRSPVRPPASAPTRAKSVLVATDSSRAAAGAVKFARMMEQEGAWAPEALTVVEHVPVAVADVALPAPVMVMDLDFTAGSIAAARKQLNRFGGQAWELYSEIGSPAGAIVDLAKRRDVGLIVLGLGKHGKLARLFGAETAARVSRHAEVPILAVEPGRTKRPATIVAAMDFGPSSVRAAQEALDLLAPGGRLHLLHVRWAIDGQTVRDEAWERTYAMGVEQGFRRLAGELRHAGRTVTWELRLGGVLESILEVAKDLDADVIATGCHSQGIVDRIFLGSTPAYLLRTARCSVLIAPPTSS